MCYYINFHRLLRPEPDASMVFDLDAFYADAGELFKLGYPVEHIRLDLFAEGDVGLLFLAGHIFYVFTSQGAGRLSPPERLGKIYHRLSLRPIFLGFF